MTILTILTVILIYTIVVQISNIQVPKNKVAAGMLILLFYYGLMYALYNHPQAMAL